MPLRRYPYVFLDLLLNSRWLHALLIHLSTLNALHQYGDWRWLRTMWFQRPKHLQRMWRTFRASFLVQGIRKILWFTSTRRQQMWSRCIQNRPILQQSQRKWGYFLALYHGVFCPGRAAQPPLLQYSPSAQLSTPMKIYNRVCKWNHADHRGSHIPATALNIAAPGYLLSLANIALSY